MKNIGIALGLSLILFACGTTPDEAITEENVTVKTEASKDTAPEELITVKEGKYVEYHPGGNQIKFEGNQDEAGERHGVWKYYDATGRQLSTTEFRHGKKHGLSIVKYPNGVIHYTGNYRGGKQIGIWTTYDEKGNRVSTKDYDTQ